MAVTRRASNSKRKNATVRKGGSASKNTANKNRPANRNTNSSLPFFKKAYVITMDTNSERYKQMEASAKAANVEVTKWDAVKVDESMKDSLMEQGIGSIIFKGAKMRLRGAIVCFLAHRNAMKHAADHPEGQATLIMEDDVSIPPDFHEKMKAVLAELPRDWDVLYLDKVNPKAVKVSEHIQKFEKQMTTHNNWGNWAYFVRNKSLKGKILPLLKFMNDPVDIQLHKFGDEINIYLATPSVITLNKATTGNSNINKLNFNT